MGNMIKVGMGDLKVCKCPDNLTTLGLGSCVGAVLYDKKTKVSGMLHCMLPDSTKISNNSNIAKFADTGLDELLKQMLALGAKKPNMVAKIAGGAQMFAFSNSNDMLRVGDRNVEAVKAKLKTMGIPIIAQDTGLNYGRTIEFYSETGILLIKAVGKGQKEI
ncbi:MAG: chemotaxis protein CheD [Catonella sp.]|jgi:chemotaxis protein CheD|nr:chemotaxis protein CheD [Catonella sp.]MDY6356155.1 chemotaxis protein CheD [Catonella sp.]